MSEADTEARNALISKKMLERGLSFGRMRQPIRRYGRRLIGGRAVLKISASPGFRLGAFL